MNYYNENDPQAAAWLRQLIADGLIPAGHVDERSITDVQPSDLQRYVQCHFFAGIAGWSLALQLAGWPSDRPTAQDGSRGSMPPRAHDTGIPLSQQVTTVGWATPTVQDSANNAAPSQFARNSLPLNCEVTLAGRTPDGTNAETEKPGAYQLNPLFSLWLMGYPIAWANAGVSALRSLREPETQSCRDLRRSSSKRS